jgi:hypothetical protein
MHRLYFSHHVETLQGHIQRFHSLYVDEIIFRRIPMKYEDRIELYSSCLVYRSTSLVGLVYCLLIQMMMAGNSLETRLKRHVSE